MDQHSLSRLLDQIIAELLAQKKQQQTHDRIMKVVISGEDLVTLPATLDALSALARSGYGLSLAFSWSASHSSLRPACLNGLAQRGITAWQDDSEPVPGDTSFHGVYLPALSSNSLSKIALGIRDNLVCRWAFHALGLNKQVIVTPNAEYRSDTTCAFSAALRARLMSYAATLVEYGITVIGQTNSNGGAQKASGAQPLITLSDVRQHRAGEALHIDSRTLITPAARDEIQRRGIVVIPN
ncbi:flavoprotein [Mixta intestinalis]|uniref:Flavoprotein domain-containing protein n=1 Tax=Mixta intestinalis TaxID=1615494 RepID=A0A6P1PVS0_9GAMM|nr:flavoprotein [Mixta intestinalis]QHM69918.1 hypothetical protein C7M51_00177 [Mixta intestinalis]